MAKNSFPMGVSPRKNLAGMVPEPGDNFGVSQTLGGVPSVAHMDNPKNGAGISHAPMAERDRNPPIKRRDKKLHNQRHPDHGPHHNSAMHPSGDALKDLDMGQIRTTA